MAFGLSGFSPFEDFSCFFLSLFCGKFKFVCLFRLLEPHQLSNGLLVDLLGEERLRVYGFLFRKSNAHHRPDRLLVSFLGVPLRGFGTQDSEKTGKSGGF